MSETQVSLSVEGAVARLNLHTESGLNVLSGAVLDRLAETVNRVRDAAGVRFLIVGATGKVFVAGANIRELGGLDVAGAVAISQKGSRVFDAIADLDCISMARIQGAALGGGLELALACDFRVAVGDAKIGLPETSLGLIPGWRGVTRMRQLAGLAATRRLVFGAAVISAPQAHDAGIIDAVVPDAGELDAVIAEWIKSFTRGGPHACAMVKKALRTGDETAAFAACFGHGESREGITAFLEKRSPSWMKG